MDKGARSPKKSILDPWRCHFKDDSLLIFKNIKESFQYRFNHTKA